MMLLTIISFIIVLGILVFIHEFGHYISAKMAGIRVEEFALGFGPKLISTRKGKTVYSIRGIPLGGFCKMTGEVPPDDNMSEEEKEIYYKAKEKGETFDQKSPWKRLAVIFNGPLMNFILAILIFILIFSVYGLPVDSTNSNIIGDVSPGMPAAEAGLRVGDRIIEINGQPIERWDQLAGVIHSSSGEEIIVKYKRGEIIKEATITPMFDETSGNWIIGITPVLIRENIGVLESITRGIKTGFNAFNYTIIGFYRMITGKTSADIGGPVMIASMIGQAADIGLVSVLNLMAILSINLGIINLLPFPALDGGRIIFILVELIRGKPVDPEKENFVHIIGFVILMIFMAFIIFKDIGRII